jgi:hypothetical protein
MKLVVSAVAAMALIFSISAPANSAEPSCAEGGLCVVGDVGPGGGTVFYVSNKPKKWGQYIEVAPNGWNRGRPDQNVEPFCYQRPDPRYPLIRTSPKIGTGKSNTNRLVKICKDGAAAFARSYRGGGLGGWSLPSKDEFDELYFVAAGKYISMNDGYPWYFSSTTDGGAVSSFYVGYESWDGSFASSNDAHVRPVRHFKPSK